MRRPDPSLRPQGTRLTADDGRSDEFGGSAERHPLWALTLVLLDIAVRLESQRVAEHEIAAAEDAEALLRPRPAPPRNTADQSDEAA